MENVSHKQIYDRLIAVEHKVDTIDKNTKGLVDAIEAAQGAIKVLGWIASIAQYSGTAYFLSDDGFYATNGQTLTGIGSEKVDRYFFNNANIGDIDSISAAVDPERNLVIWNYSNVSGGRSLLIYNFETQKWCEADTDVDYLSTLATPGATLDGLDAAYNVTAGSFVVGKSSKFGFASSVT